MADNFVMIYKNVYEDLKSGKINPLMVSAYYTILTEVDYHKGVWMGCAAKLRTAFGNRIGLHQAQNLLTGLETAGYIKSFWIKGRKGNYPVLVDGYRINGNGIALDAKATTDPNYLVYASVKSGTESGYDPKPSYPESGYDKQHHVPQKDMIPPHHVPQKDSILDKNIDKSVDVKQPASEKKAGQDLIKVLKTEIRQAGCVLSPKHLDGYKSPSGEYVPGLKALVKQNDWTAEELKIGINSILEKLDDFEKKQASGYLLNGLAEAIDIRRQDAYNAEQQLIQLEQLTLNAQKQTEQELAALDQEQDEGL